MRCRFTLLAAVLAVAGCASGEPPGTASPSTAVQTQAPAPWFAGRRLFFPVSNESDRPALLHVAEDRWPIPRAAAGVAFPSVIPPRTRLMVTFDVPDAVAWAIFVNPGQRPDEGALIISHDMGRCFGVVPIEIIVQPNGQTVWSTGPGRSCVSTE